MLKLLVVGGKLQGLEVTYLAKEAGYYVMVVDQAEEITCSKLADEHIKMDACSRTKMLDLFQKVDVVIPAIENKAVLSSLVTYSKETGVPLILDEAAYEISSSKQLSNDLFRRLDLPMPGTYPNCDYPVIVKPDDLSGSSGVYKAFSQEEVEEILNKTNYKAVVQEYLEGRSFSIEVIGDGENYFFPQITEVVIDADYDCKRIIAPAKVTKEEEMQLLEIAERLAQALKIKGIFDIEVISHKGKQKLLEIDARFPSQTPISVYHSTGINMIELLVNLKLKRKADMKQLKKQVCYDQQILVNEKEGTITVLGEHIISDCKNLSHIKNFFGADEALTDYQGNRCATNRRISNVNAVTINTINKEETHIWKAILIITGASEEEVIHKFQTCINNIKSQIGNKEWQFIEG